MHNTITKKQRVPGGKQRALACVRAAEDRKARNCVLLDMRKISSIADYFVICSGDSNRQVKGIAEAVLEALKDAGVRCWHSEGWGESMWIVLDFGDVIVHVFQDEVRNYYKIERLWGDAKTVQSRKSKAKSSKNI